MVIDVAFICQAIGSACGIAGGWLNSYGYKYPLRLRHGAAIWLAGNVFLVVMGILMKMPFYTIMMVYFTWTSWRGFLNNRLPKPDPLAVQQAAKTIKLSA